MLLGVNNNKLPVNREAQGELFPSTGTAMCTRRQSESVRSSLVRTPAAKA